MPTEASLQSTTNGPNMRCASTSTSASASFGRCGRPWDARARRRRLRLRHPRASSTSTSEVELMGDDARDASTSCASRERRADALRRTQGRRPLHREKNGFDWTYGYDASSSTSKTSSSVVDETEEEAEERWRSAEDTEAYKFRGAWLATKGRQSGGTASGKLDGEFESRMKAMRRAMDRLKANGESFEKYEPGGAEYEAFLGEHVDAHVRLARKLDNWRANFVVQFAREPEYADMPTAIRMLELDWISLGFKIRAIEKI